MPRILESGFDLVSFSLGKFLPLWSFHFLSVNGDDNDTYLIGCSGSAKG